jgi:hypothetical protein
LLHSEAPVLNPIYSNYDRGVLDFEHRTPTD